MITKFVALQNTPSKTLSNTEISLDTLQSLLAQPVETSRARKKFQKAKLLTSVTNETTVPLSNFAVFAVISVFFAMVSYWMGLSSLSFAIGYALSGVVNQGLAALKTAQCADVGHESVTTCDR